MPAWSPARCARRKQPVLSPRAPQASAAAPRTKGVDDALTQLEAAGETRLTFCRTGLVARGEVAFCQNAIIVARLWNQQSPKKDRSSNKSNPVRIGGARAGFQKASRFATARTRAPASHRKRWTSPGRKPSRGADANIPGTARFATGATANFRNLFLNPTTPRSSRNRKISQMKSPSYLKSCRSDYPIM